MNGESGYVTLAEIEAAARALPAIVRRTPVLPVARDVGEVGAERLFVKCENLQVTGAYKVRAAFTMLAALSDEQRARGVVFASSGNFAQAFALAGKHLAVRTCVVMLAETSPYKIAAARSLGAEVDLFTGPAPAPGAARSGARSGDRDDGNRHVGGARNHRRPWNAGS